MAQRQLRANIPQAFVPAALLQTPARLMPSLQGGDILDRSLGWDARPSGRRSSRGPSRWQAIPYR